MSPSVRAGRAWLTLTAAAALSCALLPARALATGHNYGAGWPGFTPTEALFHGYDPAHVLFCSPTFQIATGQTLQKVGLRYFDTTNTGGASSFDVLAGLYQVASASNTDTHTLAAKGNFGNSYHIDIANTGAALQIDFGNFVYSPGYSISLASGNYYAACIVLSNYADVVAYDDSNSDDVNIALTSFALPNSANLYSVPVGEWFVYATTVDSDAVTVPNPGVTGDPQVSDSTTRHAYF